LSLRYSQSSDTPLKMGYFLNRAMIEFEKDSLSAAVATASEKFLLHVQPPTDSCMLNFLPAFLSLRNCPMSPYGDVASASFQLSGGGTEDESVYRLS
jgi:hypothetical protein